MPNEEKLLERAKMRCQDCFYLVEDEDGDWFCENSELKIQFVPDDDCPTETGDMWI